MARHGPMSSSPSRPACRDLRNLRLDELGQQGERFLPAEIARFGWDGRRDPFLDDTHLRADGHLLERDRGLHLAGQARVVELVGMANAFIRHELEIRAAEGVTGAGGEVREGHLVGAADLRIDMVNLAGEAVRRKPFGHGIGIEERPIHPLRDGPEHSVKPNGAGGHVAPFADGDDTSGSGAREAGLPGGMPMRLSQEQMQQFDRDGYLFFPSLFRPEEIKALTDHVPALYAQRRPENVREKTGDVVRTNFAAHLYSAPFARLARHPRMVKPIEQIFGEKLYMHQFMINGKAAFDGDVWQWHQDYGTWKRDDEMPEARAMNVAIFLDEVNEFNGPLMFIPGSHKLGVLEAGHDVTTTSYPLWTINHETIGKLVDRGGIIAPKGPAGSMILFHGCLVHASSSNLSPWNRVSVYLSLCAVSNHIRRFKRPGYIAHRDFTPIHCLPEDCLLKHYDVPLPWKDGTPPEELQGGLKAA